MSADLLVGGTLGGWALERVDPATVTQVVASDDDLAARARELGHAVADATAYEPSARGLSVHFQRIVPAAVIARYEGIWNLHPGLLPWGRGFYPVFWALWEGTPAGATLHELVAELDAGPIVDQTEVAVRADDTGGTLHARVQDAERALFEHWWPRIVAGEPLPTRPQGAAASSHARSEFFALKDGGWRDLPAEDVERLRRCLEFPGFPGLETTER